MSQPIGQHAPQILIDAQQHINRSLDLASPAGDTATVQLAYALDAVLHYIADGAYGYEPPHQEPA